MNKDSILDGRWEVGDGRWKDLMVAKLLPPKERTFRSELQTPISHLCH